MAGTSITRLVQIGQDHRIHVELDVPVDFPEGEAEVTVHLRPATGRERPNRTREIFGKGEGRSWMSDDFDAPLEDFAEYM